MTDTSEQAAMNTDGPQWLNLPPIPEWLRAALDAFAVEDPDTWHVLGWDDEDGWE